MYVFLHKTTISIVKVFVEFAVSMEKSRFEIAIVPLFEFSDKFKWFSFYALASTNSTFQNNTTRRLI